MVDPGTAKKGTVRWIVGKIWSKCTLRMAPYHCLELFYAVSCSGLKRCLKTYCIKAALSGVSYLSQLITLKIYYDAKFDYVHTMPPHLKNGEKFDGCKMLAGVHTMPVQIENCKKFGGNKLTARFPKF